MNNNDINDIKNAVYNFANQQTNGDNFFYMRLGITFLVIFIFIFFSVKIHSDYNNLLSSSGFVKFYPENTSIYHDFNNPENFSEIKNFYFLKNSKALSYGEIRKQTGENNYLIVAKIGEDFSYPEKMNNILFLEDGEYLFISDSEDVLSDLAKRIETKTYPFFEQKNIKRAMKQLPKDREETVLLSQPFNFNYIFQNIDARYISIFNKLFSVCAFSIKNNEITGFFNYKDKNVFSAVIMNGMFDFFSPKTMTINQPKNSDMIFFIGIKNFDRLANIFYFANKKLKNNYTDTVNAIEENFNMKFKEEFVDYLKGDAFFYLFQSKKDIEPLIVVETKRDFSSQIKKLSMFMPMGNNNLKFTERELKKETVNIMSYKNYPKELHYITKSDSFLLGFQDVIEDYISNENFEKYDCDSDMEIFIDFKALDMYKFLKNKNYKNAKISVNFDKKLVFNIVLSPNEGK